MTYRRMAIVKRRDAHPKTTSPSISNFDRIVAGSSLFANILFGIATTTLTILALNLNKDFNEWQRRSADQQDVYAKKQACVQISFQALSQIRKNEKKLIDAAVSAISEIDPKCRKVGISVSRFTSAMIIKNSDKFPDSAVSIAKENIRKLRDNSQVILNENNANSTLSNIFTRDYNNFDRTIKPKKLINDSDISQNSSDVDKIISDTVAQIERRPRISEGVGTDLNSPFGPFKIDLTRALQKERGDQVENFEFNVGTAF